jgi:hypothetical protein
MAADSRTRSEDVDPRVSVGDGDRFPDVHAVGFRQAQQFVRQRDVHIPERVFHQFDGFRGGCVGQDDLPADEHSVQVASRLGGRPVDSADDACVLDQLAKDLPGQHPLRRIRQQKIPAGGQTRTFQDGADDILCRARRRSGFQHHEVPRAQKRADRFGRRGYIGQIGRLIRMNRRGNGDDESVGFFRPGLDGQVSGLERRLDDGPQSRFPDVQIPVPQGFHDDRVDIHADDLHSAGGEGAGGRQSDVSQSQNADFGKFHILSRAAFFPARRRRQRF